MVSDYVLFYTSDYVLFFVSLNCPLVLDFGYIIPQEKLKKRRKLLREKMEAEQREQEHIRNEELKVLK